MLPYKKELNLGYPKRRVERTKVLEVYEEDQDLLEDVIIGNNQTAIDRLHSMF